MVGAALVALLREYALLLLLLLALSACGFIGLLLFRCFPINRLAVRASAAVLPPDAVPSLRFPPLSPAGANPLTASMRLALIDQQVPPMTLEQPQYPDLRVSTITPANMQLLQQAGAWQELAAAAPTFQHMQVQGRVGERQRHKALLLVCML
jgi:hypothetical protein